MASAPPTNRLILGALSLGVSMVFSPVAYGARLLRGQRYSPPSGTMARTVRLDEIAHLRLTSRHDFTLNERGSASGTIAGTIYVQLTAVSSKRVTVTVEIRPAGGSVSGSGAGTYRRLGSTAAFSGSMSLGHGTGRYARVRGSGLHFGGAIEESHGDAITVHLTGKVSA